MNYLGCSVQVLNGLVSFLGYALMKRRSIPALDLDDIESVREMLRVFRPGKVEYEYFDALIQEYRGHLPQAVNTLRHLLEVRPNYASAKSFLAYALHTQGDAAWETVAAEVLENPASLKEEVMLMHTLRKQDEFQKGRLNPDELVKYLQNLQQPKEEGHALEAQISYPASQQGIVPNYAVRM